jgi:hypothetical protein
MTQILFKEICHCYNYVISNHHNCMKLGFAQLIYLPTRLLWTKVQGHTARAPQGRGMNLVWLPLVGVNSGPGGCQCCSANLNLGNNFFKIDVNTKQFKFQKLIFYFLIRIIILLVLSYMLSKAALRFSYIPPSKSARFYWTHNSFFFF